MFFGSASLHLLLFVLSAVPALTWAADEQGPHPTPRLRKNACFFSITPYLKQMQALAGKRVRVSAKGVAQPRVGFLPAVITESMSFITLYSEPPHGHSMSFAQTMMMIPLTEVDGDIIIDPPQTVALPGAGVGLWMPSGEMISTFGNGSYVSLPDVRGEPMAARVLAINPRTSEVTLQIPQEDVGALVFFELITSADQAAQLRLSETSKRFFESYELNTALRRSTLPSVRESWPDVTTTAVENDVAQAFIEAHRVFDPAAALGAHGIMALHALIQYPAPDSALAPNFATPGLTARSMGLHDVEQTRNEDGTLLTVGFVAGQQVHNLPDDHWFRATLNANSLEAKEYRPKVYIALPPDRLAELLPMIIAKAAAADCHQLKFGATWNDLIRDDRMVLHFNNFESSVRFAKELDLMLTALGMEGPPSAAFTYRLGKSPVSIGFDPPWGESWRYYVSRRVRDVLGAGSRDAESFTSGLAAHDIVAGHWTPSMIHERFLRALSAP